jgi:hypothetical protein
MQDFKQQKSVKAALPFEWKAAVLRLLLTGAVLTQGAQPAEGQEAPPPVETPGDTETTPTSDKEETGVLTAILPDRVEMLTLPQDEMDESPEARTQHEGSSLFPEELWPPLPLTEPAEEMEVPAPEILVSTESEPLPAEIAAAVFGAAPPPALYDPQNLLTPAQAASLQALMHKALNAKGSFQTSLVVLKPSQQIPVTLNPPELLERWHGAKKGLLVLFFLGQPDRTQAFFSPETRKFHRSEDLRQVIDFGVREAARMQAPVSQLQRFCYKTAIRLDRLHRQGTVAPFDESMPAATAVSEAGLWWAFAIGAQAAALGAGAIWWWRRRPAVTGRKGETILFPDQELVSRLGGPHSGGSGAVMQFGVAGHRL